MDRAERRARDRAFGVGRQAGDAEVGDHRPAVAREQDVAGLDVAMHDPADVCDTERTSDVEADASRLLRRQSTRPAESSGQVLAFDELHDQEWLSVISAGLETCHDVRVAQDCGRQCLAPEPHRDVGVGDDLAAEQLDRNSPVEPGVDRAMDGGHPTDADDLAQPVALADQPALVRRGRRRVALVGHAPKIAEVPETGRHRPPSALVPDLDAWLRLRFGTAPISPRPLPAFAAEDARRPVRHDLLLPVAVDRDRSKDLSPGEVAAHPNGDGLRCPPVSQAGDGRGHARRHLGAGHELTLTRAGDADVGMREEAIRAGLVAGHGGVGRGNQLADRSFVVGFGR
jgi:hypothetical protein